MNVYVSCSKHQECMNDIQLATAALSVVTWFVGASPIVSASLKNVDGLNDLALMWLALGPGMLGGLSMQLLPEIMKGHRQIVGELLCSAAAAIIAMGFLGDRMTNVFQLGGISYLAGAGGSIFIIALVRVCKSTVIRAVGGEESE